MGKFLYFLIFTGLAGLSLIGASNRDTFICDNTTKECFVRHENSILKTQHDSQKKYLGPRKNVTSYEYVDGSLVETDKELTDRYYTHYDYVTCYKDVRNVKTNSGNREDVSYRLIPYKDKNRHISRVSILKSYNTESACMVDKEVLIHYLQSSGTEPLVFQSAQNFINYIFYAVAVLFALIAVMILCSKEVKQAEAVENLTDEQKEAIYNKVKGYADVLNNLDSNTVKTLQNVADKVNKFGFRVHGNDK